MSNNRTRYTLHAELLSDTHLGTGSGGGSIDALIARDRHGRPVIWASHLEGVLRDAARRLSGRAKAAAVFGRAGGNRQQAIFTSLYTLDEPESRIWRSSARATFDNRAPKDDTLHVVEYVPKGTRFTGQLELVQEQLPFIQRLVREVDALGSGRANGAGRVKLSITEAATDAIRHEGTRSSRMVLLLKNRDPLCITDTATPGNLIPSRSYIPGRTLLGALASWLIGEGARDTASLLTGCRSLVSDALPLPQAPTDLSKAEILPAPLALQNRKPGGVAGDMPWWALPTAPLERMNGLGSHEEKLKRPKDDLFVYREGKSAEWKAFQPDLGIRLQNGRPDPTQSDPELFATERIAEGTYFLAEISGTSQDMEQLAKDLAPVLSAQRWLRVGRGGAPVEVVKVAWPKEGTRQDELGDEAFLTLTSDLLVRDDLLRWHTTIDEHMLRKLTGIDDISIATMEERGQLAMQDHVMVHGFNGTARLWRMPASAIRRGSVFKVTGKGVGKLAERSANAQWLGERIHEGFGRFRVDASLPGVTTAQSKHHTPEVKPTHDSPEEEIAVKTGQWCKDHPALTKTDGSPGLSQWYDLAGALERGETSAIQERLNPETAGGRNWTHEDARSILNKLGSLPEKERPRYARLFVRWLRTAMHQNQTETQ